jgi:1-acyl-sn-glycerol-3-phosphate acyltransferase
VLYFLLRLVIPFFLKLYNKQICFNNVGVLNTKGPLLIACNHPNSFLDAIILCAYFKRPIYSLARGDAFANPISNYLLRLLKMLPVYRQREGTVTKNYDTFDSCIEVFKNNGIVLIFSEALCVNEWQLRPIKKGTARLALLAAQQNIPLQMLCCGINYSNFYKPAKIIHVNFNTPIAVQKITLTTGPTGDAINAINQYITAQLQPLVYRLPQQNNLQVLIQYFKAAPKATNFIQKILRGINWPFIFLLQFATKKLRIEIEHHDSVQFALCCFGFIGYFFLLFLALHFFGLGYLVLLPLVAGWLYIKNKTAY